MKTLTWGIASRSYYTSCRKLIYEKGKARLLESGDIHQALIVRHSLNLIGLGFVMQKLVGSYSTGSWGVVLLEIAAMSGLGVDLYFSLSSAGRIIKQLSILEDGKQFEIKTMGLFGIGRSKIYNIENIIKPEVPSNNSKLNSILSSNTITVSTKTSNIIYTIEPFSVIYHKETLLRVLNGVALKSSSCMTSKTT
jgi:hypothetical protein